MAVVVGVAVAVTCVVVAAACVGLEIEVFCVEDVARSELASPPPHAMRNARMAAR